MTLPRIVVRDEPSSAGPDGPGRSSRRQGVVDYYTGTRSDYALWSPKFNMHFGFWRPGISPLDREAMLEQMNREVAERLDLSPAVGTTILDMGCGTGATARTVLAGAPGATVFGVTMVPWQAAEARARAARASGPSPTVIRGNYTATPFPGAIFDGVYSVESACYAAGLGKEDLLAEMARLVRPGGRFVVADAFLKVAHLRNPVTRAAHRALCESWALDTLAEIGAFTAAARRVGFDDIVVEDISINVFPSSLHIPAVTLQFLSSVLGGGFTGITPVRWMNAMTGGPLLFLAADPSAVGYFLVHATRGDGQHSEGIPTGDC